MQKAQEEQKMSDAIKVIYICFPEGKHKVLTMSYDDGNWQTDGSFPYLTTMESRELFT